MSKTQQWQVLSKRTVSLERSTRRKHLDIPIKYVEAHRVRKILQTKGIIPPTRIARFSSEYDRWVHNGGNDPGPRRTIKKSKKVTSKTKKTPKVKIASKAKTAAKTKKTVSSVKYPKIPKSLRKGAVEALRLRRAGKPVPESCLKAERKYRSWIRNGGNKPKSK